jgi:hypothetical protein
MSGITNADVYYWEKLSQNKQHKRAQAAQLCILLQKLASHSPLFG